MAGSRDAAATQAKLIAAARKSFALLGFERTTVRAIAAEAGVNPALINRYFDGKEQLFAAAVSVELNFPDLSEVPKHEVGIRLLDHFFERWEGSEEDDLLRVLIRTAATNAEAAAQIRSILTEQVTVMVVGLVGPNRAYERACLIATQILGLAYARNVLGISHTDLPPRTVMSMISGTLQRYLFEDLPARD